MRKLFFLIFLPLFWGLFSLPQGYAAPLEDEDFGYWSQNDLEWKFREDWKARLGEDVRFREHAGLVYYDTHAGLSHQTRDYLVLGADYLQVRQTRTKSGKDSWYWEERPRIYATVQVRPEGYLLENRSMLEFRFRQHQEDSIRYRNLAGLTAPWKWTRFEFQPYLSNEIFIDSSRNGVTEDRLYAGLKYHLWKNVYGSIFYLRQFTKNAAAAWKESNILGTGVKIQFQ